MHRMTVLAAAAAVVAVLGIGVGWWILSPKEPAPAAQAAKAVEGELTTGTDRLACPGSSRADGTASRACGYDDVASARPGRNRPKVRKPERARRLPNRRDRYRGRTGLRCRAVQGARFPGAGRGRADLRRRPVAHQYARRAGGAGGAMREGDILSGRQARELASRDPQAGRRPGSHGRLPHLVARESGQENRGGSQGRDRERHQRRRGRRRASAGAVFPLPGAEPDAGIDRLSRRTEHRHLFDRSRFLRLSGPRSPTR